MRKSQEPFVPAVPFTQTQMLSAMRAELDRDPRGLGHAFQAPVTVSVADLTESFQIEDLRSALLQAAVAMSPRLPEDTESQVQEAERLIAVMLWRPEMIATAADFIKRDPGSGPAYSAAETREQWTANGGWPDIADELLSLSMAAWLRVYIGAGETNEHARVRRALVVMSAVRLFFLAIAAIQGISAIIDLAQARHSDLAAWSLISDVVAGLLLLSMSRAVKSEEVSRLGAQNYLLRWVFLSEAAGHIVITLLHHSSPGTGDIVLLAVFATLILTDRGGRGGKEQAAKLLGEKSKAIRDRLVSIQRDSKATD